MLEERRGDNILRRNIHKFVILVLKSSTSGQHPCHQLLISTPRSSLNVDSKSLLKSEQSRLPSGLNQRKASWGLTRASRATPQHLSDPKSP